MTESRPPIPRPLQRAVRVEAGHRCAIPTCRATSGLQIHHILDWAKVKEHAFDNLILLCANCHARVTSGEIDRAAVRIYKANLGLLTSRYGELERRVLEQFTRNLELREVIIDRSNALLLSYLIADGMLEEIGPGEGAFTFGDIDSEDFLGPARWTLTPAGEQLVDHLRRAQEVD